MFPIVPPLSRGTKALLRLFAMGWVSVFMLGTAWFIVDRAVPAQDVPWKPLDLADAPGVATGFKLDRLEQHPQTCRALLENAGVSFTPVSHLSRNPRCEIDNGLTLDRSLTPYSTTMTMGCPLAAALYVWERHVVLPASERILGSPVVRIESYGAWSCRRVNHAKAGPWSEHASGSAADISGFRLADGRRITVKAHFRSKGPEGVFLHEIRDRGCHLFSATLSPDYNKLHADHFHFDMGVFTTCS